MAGCPRYPELQDPDWLRARYIDEGLSADQIAEMLGFECASQSVLYWLRKHNIPARPQAAPAPHGRPRPGRPRESRWNAEKWGAW